MSTAPSGRSRVAVVEDHVLFAESLEIALSLQGHDVRRVTLPETSRTVSTLLTVIFRARPGIVLLDLDLGDLGPGTQLIEPLSGAGIAVVVVTGNPDRVAWAECLSHGARTVLTKTMHLDDILATVRRIDNGLSVVSAEERAELARLWHSHCNATHETQRRLDQLSHREQEVLAHLIAGHQVHEIAAISFVSAATVRTQVKSILGKLEVRSQVAAVGLAHRAGWRLPQRALPVHPGTRSLSLPDDGPALPLKGAPR